MAGILVDFEILPQNTYDNHEPAQASPKQVCVDIQRQLASPGSRIFTGEFQNFAAHASLSGPGTSCGGWDDGGLGSASASRGGMEAFHNAAGDGPSKYGGWEAGGHHHDGGVMGLSNAELIDRINHLERRIAHTADGTSGAEERESRSRNHPPVELDALEERCHQLQQRLSATERELGEATGASEARRVRAEQAELRLKDREQLLAHAKEMWMKESVRATKMADALRAAQEQLAEQEQRTMDSVERYEGAQQELRQLQHLFGGASGGVFGGGSLRGSAPSIKARDLPDHLGFNSDPSAFGDRGGRTNRDLALAEGSRAAALQLQTSIEAVPPIEAETNIDGFRRLCLLNDAILFEDDMLQVGVKAEYSGLEGRLGVYFGNKGNGPLQAFTVQYYTSSQDHALRLTASPINQNLEPDQQLIQRIRVVLLEPFAEPPWMRIQFLLPDNSPRRIQTRLPVVITKFMIGRELSQDEFFRIWRMQQFVLNEVSNIVPLAARLRGSPIHVARSLLFGGALRLHHGVDQNPENFVLVSQLPSAAHPSHRDQQGAGFSEAPRGGAFGAFGSEAARESALSLVRVEVGAGRFAGKARVVVRSDSHTLARALCDGIIMQLSEAGSSPNAGGQGFAR